MKTEAFQGKDAAGGTGTLKSMPGPGETAPETNEPEMLLEQQGPDEGKSGSSYS